MSTELTPFKALHRYFKELRLLAFTMWLCIFPIVGSLALAIALNGLPEGREIIAIFSRQNHAAAILLTLAAALYTVVAIAYASMLAAWRPAASRPTAYLLPAWMFLVILSGVAPILLSTQIPLPTLIIFYVAAFLSMPFVGHMWGIHLRRIVCALHDTHRWIVTGVLLLLGIVTFVAIMVSPVSVPRWLGALAVLCIAVGFWSLLATIICVVAPRSVGLPSLTLLAIGWVAFCELHNDDRRLRACQFFPNAKVPDCYGTDWQPKTVSSRTQLQAHEAAWLKRACPNRSAAVRCPMIFVAAAGGGLRAAYWTAAVLNRLNDATRGAFYRHLFVISSVSGGSLGSAAFIGANMHDSEHTRYQSETLRVNALLSQDYLSPIISALVFPEVVQRVWPFPVPGFDRAIPFELTLEQTWRDTFRDGDDRMANDMLALWPSDKADAMPALFMNSTNVETGLRFIIASLQMQLADAYDAYDDRALYSNIVKLPLSAAIHLSGRFVYVSPAAVLQSLPSEAARKAGVTGVVPWGRLVDGGYYEGTGVETLSEVYSHLTLPRFVEPYIIVLLNDPRPPLLSPVSGDAPHPPGRPFEKPQPYWADDKNAIRDMQRSTTPGSDYLSPIQTWFATSGARTLGDRVNLQNTRDAIGYECGKTMKFWEFLAYGQQVPGCGGYWEISYATIETAPNAPSRLKDTASKIKAYERPALGWVLSCPSQQAMDEAAQSIDVVMNIEGSPVATISKSLEPSDRVNAAAVQRMPAPAVSAAPAATCATPTPRP